MRRFLTVGHRKVDVEHPNKVGVGLDDLLDALSRECLLPETSFDFVEDLGMARVGLVKRYSG
jgi:hypothetical protein